MLVGIVLVLGAERFIRPGSPAVAECAAAGASTIRPLLIMMFASPACLREASSSLSLLLSSLSVLV